VRAWRRTIAVTSVAAAVLLGTRHASAIETSLERQVKAAFVYKFASYVEWPDHAFAGHDDPVTIGVLGDEALVHELRRIVQGRTSGGRPIVVSEVGDEDDLFEYRVLFVSNGVSERIPAIADATEGSATLLVTESPGAIGRGTMINFVLHEGRVRFEIDLGAVSRGGLTLSSRLLGVAQTVIEGSR
jgi:hypothetical protein